ALFDYRHPTSVFGCVDRSPFARRAGTQDHHIIVINSHSISVLKIRDMSRHASLTLRLALRCGVGECRCASRTGGPPRLIAFFGVSATDAAATVHPDCTDTTSGTRNRRASHHDANRHTGDA